MREILFRGKRKDNGEWEYGYYVESVNKGSVFGYIKQSNTADDVKVYKKTVGQFTGLYANGTKIFEGDIVRFKAYGRDYVCMVEFIEGNFSAVCKNASPFLDDVVKRNDATIIGNIHDNPELLEGEME